MSVYPFQWLSTHTVYRCVWCVYIVVTIYYVYCYVDVVLVYKKTKERALALSLCYGNMLAITYTSKT